MKILFWVLVTLLTGTNAYAQSFKVLNPKIQQGDTVVVRIAPQWQGSLVCVSAFGNHYRPNERGYVFVGIGLQKKGKERIYLVECGRGVRLDRYFSEIEVFKKNFSKTRISGGGKSNRPRNNWEREAIDNAFGKANTSLGDLTKGLDYTDPTGYHEVIDSFGLIYHNDGIRGHYGVDLKVLIGTPVRSVNRGEVVLVAVDFSKEGNMVIVNHGLGVFSVYMHLSKIDVKKGEIVQGGQVIGFSGDTGAGVREPHLHFGIKILGSYVDPMVFMKTANEYLE